MLGNHCNLLGSIHVRSKWTPFLSLHLASMALIYAPVHTAISVRLCKGILGRTIEERERYRRRDTRKSRSWVGISEVTYYARNKDYLGQSIRGRVKKVPLTV